MSNQSDSPPIPRQTAGRTFIVSAIVLGLVAAIQLVAALYKSGPYLLQQVSEIRTPAASADDTAAGPTPPPIRAVQTPSAAPSKAQDAMIAKLLAEADRLARVGDYQSALRALEPADAVVPNHPRVLFARALANEKLGHYDAALDQLDTILGIPDLPPDLAGKLQSNLDRINAAAGNAPSNSADTPGAAAGDALRDEGGIQPGATLGIIDTRLREDDPAVKLLRIAVKARPDAKINPRDVRLMITFYEQTDDGEIVPTSARPVPEWISQPIDWAGGEPEILNVKYPVPEPPAKSGAVAPLKFCGYVIGLYYKGELQDSRANPGKLDKQFPLKLYLNQDPK